MKKEIWKDNKGAVLVEAVLIFPIVIILICLIYMLAMIQYHNLTSRAEAMRVANRVAMNWNQIGGTEYNILKEDLLPTDDAENESGDVLQRKKSGKYAIQKENYKEHDPYRFFVELFTAGEQKEQNIQTYLKQNLGDIPGLAEGITVETNSEISSDSGFHIFNRYVSVKIRNVYGNPMEQILANIGFSLDTSYTVTAKARLTEPAEFVRNVSYIMQIVEKLKK